MTNERCGHGKSIDEHCIACESLDRVEQRRGADTEKLQAECAALREALQTYADREDAIGWTVQDVLQSTTAGADLLAERDRDRKRIDAFRTCCLEIRDSKRVGRARAIAFMALNDDALKANETGEGGGT